VAAFFFVRRGVEHMKNSTRDRFTRFIRHAYADVLTERIPDDMRRLVEKLR
jgi:hypothetical protein